MIPEESRFGNDPDELVDLPATLPDGWGVDTPDAGDRAEVARLTELLRAHEAQGRGWAGSGVDDVLVEVSEHGLLTRGNVVVRDDQGQIQAWGSVHDRAGGRMLFVHIVARELSERVGRACSDVLLDWAVGQAQQVGAARGLDVQQIDTGRLRRRRAPAPVAARRRFRDGPHLVADEATGRARGGRAGPGPGRVGRA